MPGVSHIFEHLQVLELLRMCRCELARARQGLSKSGHCPDFLMLAQTLKHGLRKGRDSHLSKSPYSFLLVNLKEHMSTPLHLLVAGKHLG